MADAVLDAELAAAQNPASASAAPAPAELGAADLGQVAGGAGNAAIDF